LEALDMSVKNYKCKILSTFLAVMTVLSFNNPSCAMEEVLPKWKSLSGQEREKFELYQFFRGNIEDKRDINFDGKFFKQGKLSRNLNVLVIVESEGSSDEVMGKLYNNVKKLSVDSQPYKCADGELHSAVNDDKLQFIKYSASNLFNQIKSNKEFITELIDNTDLIFYVFNKDTDLINYDTFKKCYDAVNRLWCEKCGVDYPGYSHVESEDKRILWHQEAMKKRPCYSSFHYYWVTILDSSVDFEYMFNKFFRRCNLWSYNTNMPNGRETIPSKFIPYCFARYLPKDVNFVCRDKKSYKDFIEHYNAKKHQELEQYKELQKEVQTSEDEKKKHHQEKKSTKQQILVTNCSDDVWNNRFDSCFDWDNEGKDKKIDSEKLRNEVREYCFEKFGDKEGAISADKVEAICSYLKTNLKKNLDFVTIINELYLKNEKSKFEFKKDCLIY
jgi:hypothetical protein